MTYSVRLFSTAFVENPRTFMPSKPVLASAGSVGIILAIFKMIETWRDRGKPYIADIIDEKYAGPETYKKLQELLTKATADVSFWGARYLSVEGCRGVYQIERFWERINLLAEETKNLSLEERLIGSSLIEVINARDVEANNKLSGK